MKRMDHVKVNDDINSLMVGEHGRIVGPAMWDQGGWRVRMDNSQHGIVSFREDELELVD